MTAQKDLLRENGARHYIMSIREGPGNAIFSGEKPHEFRRKFDYFEGHAKIFMYITKPIGKIIGEVTIGTPIIGSVESLCQLLENNSYDTEEKLRNYLEGAKAPSALPVVDTNLYENPISLEEMRKTFGKYTPPMSFTRIDSSKYSNIKDFLLKRK